MPDKVGDVNREKFNNASYCELCEIQFKRPVASLSAGIKRHHCRNCYRSVCQKCSTNLRRLSKADATPQRVCDYCDTRMSNFKLEQNQKSIIEAQQDKLEMYEYQIEELKSQRDDQHEENKKVEEQLQAYLDQIIKQQDKTY